MAIWRNFWRLSVVGKRSSSSFKFFLRYYKDVVNLLFWVLWVCLATQIQSDTINLQKTLVFICRQKINFTTMLFWWYCKDMQTSNYGYFNHSINLYKTSMFICMPKINFINHFFLEILYFKKSWNLIGWQHFGP